jgi:AcrR family transcriptional regulator
VEGKETARRRYNADSRRTKAEATRAGILQMAKALFSKHGVDAVTIDDIARRAGVSPSTVYALFRSKAGVLKEIIQGTFFGANYARVAQRTKETDDPFELLRITASISRVIFDTEKEEIGLMRGTSAFSPELKKIEAQFERIRSDLQGQRARLLVAKFPTARNLGLAKVRDIMWMYTGRDIYRMLVLERAWSSDEYEKWLARSLIHELIGTPPANDRFRTPI